MADWLVCDMDDGVLRREPTRTAALAWWMEFQEAPRVLERHTYAPGSYSYIVGHSADDNAGTIFIERADVASRGGWDPEQAPLYPHRDRPYEYVERHKDQEG